jgi:hypothetical protein
MQIQETDPRLIEDLIFYFNEKKRVTLKNYNHVCSSTDVKHFSAAAALCKKHELDAATYVQLMYERMGDKRTFFSPMHLQGKNVECFLEDRKTNDTYKIEITNISLEPKDIWEQQVALANVYIRHGENPNDVLLSSSLKFFAWFRILAPPERNEAIIAKYKHIARKELTNKIIDFAEKEGLDIDRIRG